MDTKPTYEELEAEVAILRKQCADKDLRIAQQDVEIAELKSQVAELKARVDKLTKMLFGRKSEKSKKKDDDVLTQVLSGTEFTPKKPRKRGGGGRRPFSSEIPRRDVHVTLAPDECHCPHCGKALKPMGAEISETLNFIPMILEAIRFIRTAQVIMWPRVPSADGAIRSPRNWKDSSI